MRARLGLINYKCTIVLISFDGDNDANICAHLKVIGMMFII